MQILFRLLVLVAVMLMPLGMAPASATSHDRTMAGMPMEHCPDQAPVEHGKSAFAACTMACSAALPALGGPANDLIPQGKAPIWRLVMRRLHGLHPETATPPPRIA